MKSKKLWFLAILLLLIQFILDYVFHTKNDFSNGIGISIFAVDLIAGIITIVLFGLPLGLLMALIPYKKKTFNEKFKITLPAAISVVLIILILLMGYKYI